ncbi:DNA adenine methylase [candidate division WOR-3 bacterium]|nr:DNA adenine methylase [candidate division WOR-3 bacterium]
MDWIWGQIANLDFKTCLDAFGGTGAVAYRFKEESKDVAYNDLLRFNYYFGKALIENDKVHLDPSEVKWTLQRHPEITYPRFVQDNFADIYFTDEENAWIDQTITNIKHLKDPHKFAMAFFALCQACIIKRPYNLFHRKNLYIRFADVERSFGNKTTWDKPFEEWFRIFVEEANRAVFDNGERNRAFNHDAVEVPGVFDLVYIDTPYISSKGVAVDYLDFYHFLEGLTMYEEWGGYLDEDSKHRRLKPRPNDWTNKNRIHKAFDRLFQRYHESILVVSYRKDGIPSEGDLVHILRKHKNKVRVEHYDNYRYVLSTNSDAGEMLLVGTD